MLLSLDNKDFDEITRLIKNPVDYFDFPSSSLAFAYSMKGSSLFIKDKAVFRIRNRQLTLIGYYCSGRDLNIILESLAKRGFKTKSLNFVNKNFHGLKIKPYMNEFFVERGYNLDYVLEDKNSKSRNKLRRKLRIANQTYQIDVEIKLPEVLTLFEKWYKSALERHFMVIRGHYLAYIFRYFEDRKNVRILGFRKKDTGDLYGIAGYEIFQNKAQLTLMKHLTNDYNFPKYFWTTTLGCILKDKTLRKVFCGTTANMLKNELRMSSKKSFKIDMSCYY